MQEKKSGFLVASFALIQFFLCCSFLCAQGDLTPPGAPAPELKTLEEVYTHTAAARSSADTAVRDASEAKDPRTPISASDIPLTITSPGSYYLAEDIAITIPDVNGITIDSDNVFLDLNGFTLKGPGKSAGTSGSGIYVVESDDPPVIHYNVSIKNGVLTDWRGYGVNCGSLHNRIERVKCYNNGKSGLRGGPQSSIENNVCKNNGEHGIIVRDSCLIRSNATYENGGSGIFTGSFCTVEKNACTSNTLHGIMVIDAILTKNTCSMNKMCGMVANYNSLISGNTCMYNAEDGIQVNNSCLIVDNVCYHNGEAVEDGAGIQVNGENNCIEKNLVSWNDVGIDCSLSGGNCIVSNRAGRVGTPYNIGVGNTTFTGDRENVTF